MGLHPSPCRVAVLAVGVVEKEADPLSSVVSDAVLAAVIADEGEVACRVAGEIDGSLLCPEQIALALRGVGVAVAGDGVEQQQIGPIVAQGRVSRLEIMVDEAVEAALGYGLAPCLVNEVLSTLRSYVLAKAPQKVDVVDKGLFAIGL